MDSYLRQAQHNEDFHASLCSSFPEKYHDWKITCVFYIAIHLLKALAASRGINIGHTHWDIEKNVNPRKNDAKMRISENAWEAYSEMLYYSKTARYDGITDDETFEELKKEDYSYAIKKLAFFKKYIQGQMLP